MGHRAGRDAALTTLLTVSGVVLGAVLGSFVATLVVRWPSGEPVTGRSRCDGCGITLPVVALVPLISFAILRGRSACCDRTIKRVHPLAELVTAAAAAIAFARLGVPLGLLGTLLAAILVALALLDWRHFWLPDRLVAPLAVIGLALAVFTPTPTLGDRAIGLVAGWASLATIAFLYRGLRGQDGLGAGDPKLFGALGAWIGWQDLPFVLLGASLLGLAWALWLAARRQPVGAKTALPFGTFLAAAAFPVWLLSAG